MVCAQVRALGQSPVKTSLLWKCGYVTVTFASVKKYYWLLGTTKWLCFCKGMRHMPLVAYLAHLIDQVKPTCCSYQLSWCGQEGDFSKKCFRDTGVALGLPEHTNPCLFYDNRHYNKQESVTFLVLYGKADLWRAGDEGAARGRAAGDTFLAAILFRVCLPQNVLAASKLKHLLSVGTSWLPVLAGDGRGGIPAAWHLVSSGEKKWMGLFSFIWSFYSHLKPREEKSNWFPRYAVNKTPWWFCRTNWAVFKHWQCRLKQGRLQTLLLGIFRLSLFVRLKKLHPLLSFSVSVCNSDCSVMCNKPDLHGS